MLEFGLLISQAIQISNQPLSELRSEHFQLKPLIDEKYKLIDFSSFDCTRT